MVTLMAAVRAAAAVAAAEVAAAEAVRGAAADLLAVQVAELAFEVPRRHSPMVGDYIAARSMRPYSYCHRMTWDAAAKRWD
jgi:hypothetical protein